MHKTKKELDLSWQEVSALPENARGSTIARQSSLQAPVIQRADSSFEHIDESIMVLNSSHQSVPLAPSPDSKQPPIPPGPASQGSGPDERVSPCAMLISEKLTLYQAQIDRFLSSAYQPGSPGFGSEEEYRSYLDKLRRDVENLKKIASIHLDKDCVEQAKSSNHLLKSNLLYELGKLDELMNNFYLNHTTEQIISSPVSASTLTSSILASSSLINDFNQSMTLSSSIDVLSLASEFQKASLIQQKVMEQNRLLKELVKSLSQHSTVSSPPFPSASVTESPSAEGRGSSSIPIQPSTSNDLEDDYVTSFSPGTSPSQFTMLAPANQSNVSLTSSIISFRNKLFGKKSKSRDSKEDPKSPNRSSSASSSSLATSASCTLYCVDANSNATTNGGNTLFDDEESSQTLSSNQNTVDSSSSNQQRQAAAERSLSNTSVSDVQRKALNLFYSCPRCNMSIYRDQISFDNYTEHIRNCYFPNHSCFICWRLFEPNQFEQFQRHVHNHLDQANEDGFIAF